MLPLGFVLVITMVGSFYWGYLVGRRYERSLRLPSSYIYSDDK